jgi:diguanylate cyclase (GGDEF)-like protein
MGRGSPGFFAKNTDEPMKIITSLWERSLLFWTITGLIGVIVVGVADTLTGAEFAFSLFYLLPIVLVTWFSGRNLGLVMSVVSAVTWFAADALAGQVYSQPLFRFWNAFVRLGFFVIVTYLLPVLKALEHEKETARIDELTGAANRRHFFEVAQSELDRSQRTERPFSTVYLDIDNFKDVNDKWGHQVGDQLLCALVNRARLALRKTDLLARLGGDEFIALLPETGGEAAHIVVGKLQHALLEEMHRHHWPVTFSIGVLTCADAHLTPDELISRADALMYTVKKKGKNDIAYAVYVVK